MKVLCIFVTMIVAIKADYHDEVGIPLAAKIKEYEDKIMNESPDMESRVVAGEVAPEGAHPYLVGLIITLLDNTLSICGSSLVTANRLLTAGHCVDRAQWLEAVLGSKYLHYGGLRMRTDVFAKHPLFNWKISFANDIAVVALPSPVEFSAIIHPIDLPWTPEEAEVIGEWGVAAGYGITSDLQVNVPINSIVNEVRLMIIPDEVCNNQYGSSPFPNVWICTKGTGHSGTCRGDSGGPMFVERNGRKILVGLTSFGGKLCELGLPSVFTRIATYLDFIQQNV